MLEKSPQGDLVRVERGEPMTTSLKVAEVFGKSHAHVMRDIKSLQVPDVWNQSNFGLVEYRDAKGEMRPSYNITRDGFAILAMGFTGEKAMAFKLAYIAEFNRMAETIRGIAEATLQAASERQQQALLGTVRAQEVALSGLQDQNRRLRAYAELAKPVRNFGELSAANGLPKMVYRRPTFAAPPRLVDITEMQMALDCLQLQLDLYRN